ncbi:MAG: DUF1622 domain-containing protein [Erysipelotrichaceae bacterium]|nr:DUF1622 domain-containing protein [Erysipelotrichaceae bacterium]
MEAITEILHHGLTATCEFLVVVIEIIGTVLMIIGLGKELRKIIKYRFKFRDILADPGLNRAMSTVLEVFLSAEILKTVYISDLKSLFEVGILILLRVFMAFTLSYEGHHKGIPGVETVNLPKIPGEEEEKEEEHH